MNTERSQLYWPNYPTSIPSLMKFLASSPSFGNLEAWQMQDSSSALLSDPSPLPPHLPHFCKDTLWALCNLVQPFCLQKTHTGDL